MKRWNGALREWPEELNLTTDLIQYARAKNLEPHDEWEAFHDHALANASKYKDWAAAFRTWCRNAVKFQPRSVAGFTGPAPRPAYIPPSQKPEYQDPEPHLTVEERRVNLQKLHQIVNSIGRR